MAHSRQFCIILLVAVLAGDGCAPTAVYQMPEPPHLSNLPLPAETVAVPIPPHPDNNKPLAVNLPTALSLANVRALDVELAAQRIQAAAATLEQANVLWLPTITIGGDYNRHDGQYQDTSGDILNNSRSSTMFGLGTGIGPAAILNVNEAIFTPLVARQQLRARQADQQTVSNDTLLSVSDAYFNVQQARGELAGALDALRRTDEMVRRTKRLAPGLVPELETTRVEAEAARRQQAEFVAREKWRMASSELLRLLRLDPTSQVTPIEPPQLRIDLVALDRSIDDLIAVGLMHRPELASQQAQVQATLTLLKQEKLRPLIPSVLLRGYSTPVTGTLAAGVFGGGSNSSIGNSGLRADLDLQVLWQLDNLGFGNRARIHQRQAENKQALTELFRMQDRIAAEIAQAHAQAQLAARRAGFAEKGLRLAIESADKNLLALGQTKGADNRVVLLIGPLAAVQAVQALGQAYLDYFGAVADANRAQFRLYRALGQPAECMAQLDESPKLATPSLVPASQPANSEESPIEAAPPKTNEPAKGDTGWQKIAAGSSSSTVPDKMP
jgi:outer membrane protein TolC